MAAITIQDGRGARTSSERTRRARDRWTTAIAIFALTPLIFFVQGYHPFAGDAGIYVAGIRHILDPSLYPINAAFVTSFSRISIFPWAVAGLVRISALPLPWILFFLQIASIALFLTAVGQMAARLFGTRSARLCSMTLAAAWFSLPVAGTALFVMDPYITPRSFSTPLALFAVAAALDRRWLRAALLVVLAMLLHPLMGLYAGGFVVVQGLLQCGRVRTAAALCLATIMACGIAFAAAHSAAADPAYREAVSLAPRSFLFLSRWRFYEVLGLVLPLALLALPLRWFSASAPIGVLCLACLLCGATSIAAAALFVPAGGPRLLVPLQFLRSFHLIYCIGIVLAGGSLSLWLRRWPIARVAPLALLFPVMFVAQRAAWSGCRDVEWPGTWPANPYQQAFLWIRSNTPRNAIFAFDADLVYWPGEDEQGFRAIAERDQVADDKDAGVVAVIPNLAKRWARQRNADVAIESLSDAERIALLRPLGASWLLLRPDAATRFPCPYRNTVVKVCSLSR